MPVILTLTLIGCFLLLFALKLIDISKEERSLIIDALDFLLSAGMFSMLLIGGAICKALWF